MHEVFWYELLIIVAIAKLQRETIKAQPVYENENVTLFTFRLVRKSLFIYCNIQNIFLINLFETRGYNTVLFNIKIWFWEIK